MFDHDSYQTMVRPMDVMTVDSNSSGNSEVSQRSGVPHIYVEFPFCVTNKMSFLCDNRRRGIFSEIGRTFMPGFGSRVKEHRVSRIVPFSPAQLYGKYKKYHAKHISMSPTRAIYVRIVDR